MKALQATAKCVSIAGTITFGPGPAHFEFGVTSLSCDIWEPLFHAEEPR